jgi:alkylation response protein AidB-like acyl-CoA dehydrogenase
MDFNFTDEQQSLRDLAREILEQEMTQKALARIDAGDASLPRDLWKKLADANLLGIAVPEECGGMGYGVTELFLLMVEIGRAVAPVPAFASLVLAGLPIGRFGSDAQKQRWLTPMATGEVVLTGAYVDAHSGDVATPATTAVADGAGFRLDGAKRFVPAGDVAARILVPARTEAGVGLFLVGPHADGVELTAQEITNCEVVFDVALDGVRVGEEDLLGGDAVGGGEKISWAWDCALTALAAEQLGVSEKAVEITTHYVSQREQFGAPIGSFPAVQHRCADMFIDLNALRWTMWHAASTLDRGEDASRYAMVAKVWTGEAGSRIANASQHLHGGAGVDRDYPLHRYFLWSKAL